MVGGDVEELIPLGSLDLAGPAGEVGRSLGDLVERGDGMDESCGRCGLSFEPGDVGVGGVEDLVEPPDLAAIGVVAPVAGVDVSRQPVGSVLQAVEMLFDLAMVCVDRPDRRVRLLERLGGVSLTTLRAASAAERGVERSVPRLRGSFP